MVWKVGRLRSGASSPAPVGVTAAADQSAGDVTSLAGRGGHAYRYGLRTRTSVMRSTGISFNDDAFRIASGVGAS